MLHPTASLLLPQPLPVTPDGAAADGCGTACIGAGCGVEVAAAPGLILGAFSAGTAARSVLQWDEGACVDGYNHGDYLAVAVPHLYFLGNRRDRFQSVFQARAQRTRGFRWPKPCDVSLSPPPRPVVVRVAYSTVGDSARLATLQCG